MSYMRGDVYVFGDGDGLNISVGNMGPDGKGPYREPTFVWLPNDKADDLAVMLVAKIIQRGDLAKVCKRAMEYGNFGGDALLEMFGQETSMHRLIKDVEKIKRRKEKKR